MTVLSRRRLRVVGLILATSLSVYLAAPAFYLALEGVFSHQAYMALLRVSPIAWNRLLKSLETVDSRVRDAMFQLLANTPDEYWDVAVEAVRESPGPVLEDTVLVLSVVKPEEWRLVGEAIRLYLSGFTPFNPPSEELKREYVDQLAISGEEPILDWRYMVYIFTYRLVQGKKNACEAAKTMCEYVHKYLTYDAAFWHRRSPKTLITLKRGTCTNFSILFVAMCRAMGIPARLVRDNSISPITHAWSEFYLEGRGWVHADPTAGYFDYPQAYRLEWGYRFHLVKAFSPLKGWVDITPSYVADYGVVAGVVKLNGEPVRGAEVSVYYPENLRVLFTVETSEDGSFEFTAAEGTYILEVSYRGVTDTLTVTVDANETAKVEVNLD